MIVDMDGNLNADIDVDVDVDMEVNVLDTTSRTSEDECKR
jgi:hypothetical protein